MFMTDVENLQEIYCVIVAGARFKIPIPRRGVCSDVMIDEQVLVLRRVNLAHGGLYGHRSTLQSVIMVFCECLRLREDLDESG